MPFLMILPAGWRLWIWLWGRWFSTGGEFLHGGLHLALMAGGLWVFLPRPGPSRNCRPGGTHLPSLMTSAFFLLGAALSYGRLPTLMTAGLYVSAVYWALRASASERRGKPGPGLWALFVLSLPITPSLQFVFGYPLRALAARAAALMLPGAVRATGCGLSDGRISVFVDAPCAGAGMLVVSLFLAAGAALIYRLGWLRTGLMLVLGAACAIYANAVRAALLYLGAAGLIAVPLHRYETATGFLCFTVSALMLLTAAAFLARYGHGKGQGPKPEAVGPNLGRRPKVMAAYGLMCAALFFISLHAPAPAPASVRPLKAITWPETWETRALIPIAPSPETEKFWSGFPGAYREFMLDSPEAASGRAPIRVVMRLATRPTRRLHPAEDCFRGAGFSITPLPAEKDEANRLWSGFAAKRDGRAYVVRQCVIAADNFDLSQIEGAGGGRAWPDVSSWYWDTARPGAATAPLALAVTVIAPRETAPLL